MQYDDWPPKYVYVPTRKERIKDTLITVLAMIASLIIVGLQFAPSVIYLYRVFTN